MFQSGKVRESAEECHICNKCVNEKICNVKPYKKYGWRYILTYCQKFKE